MVSNVPFRHSYCKQYIWDLNKEHLTDEGKIQARFERRIEHDVLIPVAAYIKFKPDWRYYKEGSTNDIYFTKNDINTTMTKNDYTYKNIISKMGGTVELESSGLVYKSTIPAGVSTPSNGNALLKAYNLLNKSFTSNNNTHTVSTIDYPLIKDNTTIRLQIQNKTNTWINIGRAYGIVAEWVGISKLGASMTFKDYSILNSPTSLRVNCVYIDEQQTGLDLVLKDMEDGEGYVLTKAMLGPDFHMTLEMIGCHKLDIDMKTTEAIKYGSTISEFNSGRNKRYYQDS